jgi:hypothetical protein
MLYHKQNFHFKVLLFSLGLLISMHTFGQFTWVKDNPYKKGDFFLYWGWNRGAFSHSDIHFFGDHYDFTLYDVAAKDRQSPFEARIYFNPVKFTIPQYNFRVGYFLSNNYQLSLGADHMKYVMINDQNVTVNGYINGSGTAYDGNYNQDSICLSKDFLMFEHTDGLNYMNAELRRFDVLFGRKNFAFAINEGFGAGILLPRTNTTLLQNERYDEYHLAGYGISMVVAANLTFLRYFFIQSEWKGGFIHMPDIRTTMYTSDRASQHFFFSQYNLLFGFRCSFTNRKKAE